ncbi:histidine ammonia-lyase [Aneurinibacillus soli]|uniref:Histidine ammonia-lyase n=1 Tax=Aneurinibacillus soli TaxID=1500254 RepID=A0A0U5AV11_9BACL|nr:histidine ammonia-lyase [Aneurinibacillus soli]PYE58950.1 histidine ammonia-lyase [Aneurinibacillus soli]BAU26034.1 Histidine ammonia-lyase [Aneurinibacillus soli]
MITVKGHSLTLADVKAVLYDNEKVVASAESLARVDASRRAVEKIVAENRVAYGINTGFGKLSDVVIDQKDVESLQLNLIRSHACGVGEPFPEIVSRAMLLLRANALLKGHSGVRRQVIDCLLALLNKQIHPVVPQQGSLGASGDLAPLSHLTLALIGEGEVFYKGEIVPSLTALQKEGITPLVLTAKEGLALINGTQAMTAMGVVAYLEAEQLAYQSELIASLTLEGLRGIIDAFAEEVQIVRGYPEQIAVAERIRSYVADSKLITRQGELRVQDAYSLRCIPQVHGASWQALNYVKEKLEIEINAATDNPLIFDDGEKVISGGNFHGQPIAFAMDFLAIAMAEFANISERRIERLVNPQLNDLPPFLSPQPGVQSGAMILQYCAAALVSENKTLAHPASVDSIPSSANQEDHVSMGTIGARHAYQVILNCRKVLAIELICALQAVEYRGVEKTASITKQFHTMARTVTPAMTKDRIFSKDINAVDQFLKATDVNQVIKQTPKELTV